MRALLLILAVTTPAAAATFVVDTGADISLNACTPAPDDCSLRGAIVSANATGATDTIEFSIPTTDPSYQVATDHWRIQVGNSGLPLIEQGLVIDGYSQPGALANTQTPEQGGSNARLKIELQPANGGLQQTGLEISLNFFNQPASVFRGLAINRFTTQIFLSGSSPHRVEGCFLGTNIDGTQPALVGNSGLGNGVRVNGPGPYVIGGLNAEARNVISGMFGAIVMFSASDGLRIEGNLIGTNAAGTAAIPNRQESISSAAPLTNARIGGADPAARNIISGSSLRAIYLSPSGIPDPFAGTRIEGNYFGTDVTGKVALGNGLNPSSPSQAQSTIQIFGGGACAIVIGGAAPGQANLIAHGGAAGLQIGTCRGVSSPFNRFIGNRGIAIDNSVGSNADGPTANDANDADDGGNRLQNSPAYAVPPGFLPSGGSSVEITASVDSAPANAAYPLTINVYRAGCGGGSSELIASETIDLAAAQQPRTFTVTAADGNNLLPLTLLARDAEGNGSEFAPMLGDAIMASGLEDVEASLTVGHCRN